MWVQSLGGEDPLEEEMATHSSILAWRIPRTGEPGWLQSIGSQRVEHHWVTDIEIACSPQRPHTGNIILEERSFIEDALCQALCCKCFSYIKENYSYFPGHTSGKESASQFRRHRRHKFDPWVRKIPWRRAQQPTPAFLPGESHGQRSLLGYSPWVTKNQTRLSD